MLEIVICCDDPTLNQWLKDVIDEYMILCHVFINVSFFSDCGTLLACMENGLRFQIVVIDLLMGALPSEISVGEPALLIRKFDRNCIIILIAESAEYALWGYTLHAFDYMVKPLDRRRVVKAIDEAAGACRGNIHNMIPVKSKGINTPVKCSAIICIESIKHHLRIHTTNRSVYQVCGKLDDYETRLTANASFLRCHQSFLINMDHVESISGRDFVMINGMRIPIRKSTAGKLKKEYYQYIMGSRGTGL